MKKKTVALLSGIFGITIGAAANFYYFCRKFINREKQINLYRANYELLRRWISICQNGKSIEIELKKRGYGNIAIYSMNEAAQLLYEELKDGEVLVKYAIDSNTEDKTADLPILQLHEGLERVDVIVVCDLIYFEEIREALERTVPYPVLALDDLIYGI